MTVLFNTRWLKLRSYWPRLTLASRDLLVDIGKSLADINSQFEADDIRAVTALTGLLARKRESPEAPTPSG